MGVTRRAVTARLSAGTRACRQPDALYKKRGGNRTIFQRLEHLLAPQELLLKRIQKFIDEPAPVMTTYNPEYTDYSLKILAGHVFMHDGFHRYGMEDLWLLKDEFLKGL